jgi:hypothetical protein
MLEIYIPELTLIFGTGIIIIVFILIFDHIRFKKEILYIHKRDFQRLARHQLSRFHPVECHLCKARDGRWFWSRENIKHSCWNHNSER